MTNRDDASPPIDSRLGKLGVLTVAALLLLAVNLFGVEPFASRHFGQTAAVVTYMLIRIGTVVGLAFALGRDPKRNWIQVISTVLLVGFIEQVFLKGIWLKLGSIPADAPSDSFHYATIFLNMGVTYLAFLPFMVILGFVGMEAGRYRRGPPQ